ncbi:MAG: matrixin family metalloprotease [Candidatus Obscuribacterales bacterium]|nr:matrixin family metalloprotease [Candidatus Obscuribacterales bacterium]
MQMARVALALLCAVSSVLGISSVNVQAQEYSIRQVSAPVVQMGVSTDTEALIAPLPLRAPDYSRLETPVQPVAPRRQKTNAQAMARARQLSGVACEYIRTLRYAEAEQLLNEALSMAPSLVSAHSNLGFLFNKTGRPYEALPHLEYAASAAPEQPAPLVTLAGAYQLMGMFDKAIATYRAYLSRFPYAQDQAFIRDILSRLEVENRRTVAIKSSSGYNGEDYLSFSNQRGILVWPKDSLKVYIGTGNNVRGYKPAFTAMLKEAFLSWEAVGPLKFQFVETRQGCDIDCSWVDNPGMLSSPGEGGEAIMSYERQYLRHSRILLLTKRTTDDGNVGDNEMFALCLHEVGHALGLVEHSPNHDDVMFCTVLSTKTKPQLSRKDVLTFQRLYSTGVRRTLSLR